MLGNLSPYKAQLRHHIRYTCATILALLCHNFRHKLCGRVLLFLPSISTSLFKLCLTTINQHKLYSITTFADTRQFLNAPQFLSHYKHKQQTVVPYRYTLLSRCALTTQHTAQSCQQYTDPTQIRSPGFVHS